MTTATISRHLYIQPHASVAGPSAAPYEVTANARSLKVGREVPEAYAPRAEKAVRIAGDRVAEEAPCHTRAAVVMMRAAVQEGSRKPCGSGESGVVCVGLDGGATQRHVGAERKRAQASGLRGEQLSAAADGHGEERDEAAGRAYTTPVCARGSNARRFTEMLEKMAYEKQALSSAERKRLSRKRLLLAEVQMWCLCHWRMTGHGRVSAR